MLWDFKLFYLSSSIPEVKLVLRPRSRFLKFEARNTGNRYKPMIKIIQPPEHR